MTIPNTTTIDRLRVSNQLNTNSTSMSKALFNKLDTETKGYISEQNIADSFSTDNNLSAHDIFTSIDTDHNQQISQTELSTRIESLASELNSQLDMLRTTFSKELLSKSETNTSSNNDAELIKQLETQNNEADLNHDGFVTIKEKAQYEQNKELALLKQTNLDLLSTYKPTSSNVSIDVKV